MNLSLSSFFNLQVVSPKDMYKYFDRCSIIKIILDNIMPLIEQHDIKMYIVPLPFSNDGIYWTDYPHSYLSEFYGSDYDDIDY